MVILIVSPLTTASIFSPAARQRYKLATSDRSIEEEPVELIISTSIGLPRWSITNIAVRPFGAFVTDWCAVNDGLLGLRVIPSAAIGRPVFQFSLGTSTIEVGSDSRSESWAIVSVSDSTTCSLEEAGRTVGGGLGEENEN